MNPESLQFWTTWIVRIFGIAFSGYLAGKGVSADDQAELFSRVANLVASGGILAGCVAWSWFQRARHKQAKDTLQAVAMNSTAMRVLPGETYEQVRRVTKVTI